MSLTVELISSLSLYSILNHKAIAQVLWFSPTQNNPKYAFICTRVTNPIYPFPFPLGSRPSRDQNTGWGPSVMLFDGLGVTTSNRLPRNTCWRVDNHTQHTHLPAGIITDIISTLQLRTSCSVSSRVMRTDVIPSGSAAAKISFFVAPSGRYKCVNTTQRNSNYRTGINLL